MKEQTQKGYQPPSLTVYGSVETITANQSSLGGDVPSGPNSNPTNYYSVGK